jgi:hypothetical protein
MRGWGLLYAGYSDYAISIADRAKEMLKKSGANELAMPTEVRNVMRTAFQQELREQIADRFLSRYNLTAEEFRKNGKRQFGNDFEVLNKPIREFSLNTSFLACGVDAHEFPHILWVQGPGGSVTSEDTLGHAAIGSGREMALGSLGSSSASGSGIQSIPDLAYRVVKAKFIAESARGVGKSTILVIWRKGLDHPIFMLEDNPFRQAMDNELRQHAPEIVTEFIKDSLTNAGMLERQF